MNDKLNWYEEFFNRFNQNVTKYSEARATQDKKLTQVFPYTDDRFLKDFAIIWELADKFSIHLVTRLTPYDINNFRQKHSTVNHNENYIPKKNKQCNEENFSTVSRKTTNGAYL